MLVIWGRGLWRMLLEKKRGAPRTAANILCDGTSFARAKAKGSLHNALTAWGILLTALEAYFLEFRAFFNLENACAFRGTAGQRSR